MTTMSEITPGMLVKILDLSRKATLAKLGDADPETVIHPGSGWTITDIIGHMADWEAALLDSARAGLRGEIHLFPGMEDVTNREDYDQLMIRTAARRRATMPMDHIFADWRETRSNFITFVQTVTPEQMTVNFTPPWGGDPDFTVRRAVDGAIQHEDEHLHEIIAEVTRRKNAK